MTITKRSLDHFVISVTEVERAGAAYRNLGFRVMPVMQHLSIGTSNCIVQFLDTYLELIGESHLSSSQTVSDVLAPWTVLGEDAYWQTSVTSKRLEDEVEPLRRAGLNPQPIASARRPVRLPGRGWDETASRSFYTLNEARVHGSLFISDHPKPEAIWIADYQCHPNTMTHVTGIFYLADDPLADEAYYTTMFGAGPAERSADRLVFRTPRGENFIVVAAHVGVPGAQPLQSGVAIRGAAFEVAVTSLDHCRWALRDGGVPFRELEGRLIAPASHGCGMALHFHQQGPRI